MINHTTNKRVELLDYFRGFMAISILVYHYSSWSEVKYFSQLDQIISKLGIYGVLTFYVLSGTSLAIVYSNRKLNSNLIIGFSIKRFFRIAPLFYLATTSMIILIAAQCFINKNFSDFPSVKEIIFNYTLIFGWISPSNYITTGAWSIGNELVFYSIFPFMIFLLNKSIKSLSVFFLGTIFISVYFSEFLMDSNQSLSDQWSIYINPLHLLYFFVAGFIIGTLLKRGIKIKRIYLLLLLISSVLLFVLLPAEADIAYVTGANKVLFSLVVFCFCIFAAFWGDTRKTVFTKLFKFFGDTSYSIYLIHPLVYIVLKVVFDFINFSSTISLIILSTALTLAISFIIFKYVERPFIKKGKIISEKITVNRLNEQTTNAQSD